MGRNEIAAAKARHSEGITLATTGLGDRPTRLQSHVSRRRDQQDPYRRNHDRPSVLSEAFTVRLYATRPISLLIFVRPLTPSTVFQTFNTSTSIERLTFWR